MLKTKFVVPFIAVLLVLLYVPHASMSASRLQHKVGSFLTDTGRGLGHFLDSVTS